MKKLLTILLVLISFSSFAQFEAGEYVNADTTKIDGVPLLLNTFKKGNLGGASNIFYSTGASSQPASGTVNQVVGNSYIQNQNSAAQSANMWISGSIRAATELLEASTVVPFLGIKNNTNNRAEIRYGNLSGYQWYVGLDVDGLGTTDYMIESGTGLVALRLNPLGAATFASTITGTQLISNIPTGTPPLVVASSTKVDNLNVGLLDGKHASDFQLQSDTLTFDATLSDLADSSAAIRALANTKAVVSGTDNYIPKITGANTLGNSSISEDNTYNYFTKTPYFSNGFNVTRMSTSDLHNNKTANSGILTNSGLGILNKDSSAIAYSGWWHVINMHHTDNNGFNAQIIAPLSATDQNLHWRNSGSGTWSDWKTIKSDNGADLWGFGTLTPAARVHSQSTGTQARLGYDVTKYTDLSTGSTGNLTIDPTGDTVKVVGAVNSTGGFFKNGVEITGGTGSMVYPINSGIVTYNGTTWGTSITNNSNLWNNAYDKKIVSAAFSGTSTKTLTLYQQDGNVLQASFTDQSGGAGNWSTDTYGLYYDEGQVGVGANSVSNTWLTVGSGTSSKNGVYAYSGTNAAVHGVSGYIGVFGESPNGYGVYGVSGTSYGGVFDRGVNIASGNLDIQGQTRISQSGFFQPVSSSDAAAPNNSIYYSTTQSKLVYKNASGTVNVLY